MDKKTNIKSDRDLELCYLSSTESLIRFRAHTLSPVELVDELIKRVDEINPIINAFNMDLFEETRDAAK